MYCVIVFFIGTSAIANLLALNINQSRNEVVTLIGPKGNLIHKSTLKYFEKEFEELGNEQVSKAKDYFKAGINDLDSYKFIDASKNFKKSIDTIESMSGYLNYGISLFYTSNYDSALDAFYKGLAFAKKMVKRNLSHSSLATLALFYLC